MKYKKYWVAIIIVGIMLLAKYVLGEFVEDTLDKANTPHEIMLQELYATKEKYEKWEELRKIEKTKGEHLYIVEDMIPELHKPKEWEDFFLLKEIPEKYYLEKVYSRQQEDNWIVTYAFHNFENYEEFFFFTQTKSKSNKDDFQKKEGQKQGDYYIIQEENRSKIYYIKDRFILQLEGNLDVADLVSIMDQVDSYKNFDLQY